MLVRAFKLSVYYKGRSSTYAEAGHEDDEFVAFGLRAHSECLRRGRWGEIGCCRERSESFGQDCWLCAGEFWFPAHDLEYGGVGLPLVVL